ncbi:hypothetical protein TNCV_3769611 [Trichonephila clavipes]|nr:hypothetical protein TNCV_3769611 [Trichonephila clavipes]
MFFTYPYKKFEGVRFGDLGGHVILEFLFLISWELLQFGGVPFRLYMCCRLQFDKPCYSLGLFLRDEAHFWLNGYVNKQNCRIWSEANPQVYVETPLHPEKLTVWCALWAGGILLQKR